MSDDHKKTLQTQLRNIANTLRGKMGPHEFRDDILGFIFYKYLSERMHLFADEILEHDDDLAAVAGQLPSLEQSMVATVGEIAGFCAELGIEAPFRS